MESSTAIAAGPCTLRPWRIDDLDALLRHADNAAIARQLRDAVLRKSAIKEGRVVDQALYGRIRE